MKSQVVTFFGCILIMVVGVTLVAAKKQAGKAAPVDGKKFYYPKESRATSAKHRHRRDDDVVSDTNRSAHKTILYQNYQYNNLTGEYVHEYVCGVYAEFGVIYTIFYIMLSLHRLEFSDSTRRTEIGGYVSSGHDTFVYVIRGFYSRIQPESVSFFFVC